MRKSKSYLTTVVRIWTQTAANQPPGMTHKKTMKQTHNFNTTTPEIEAKIDALLAQMTLQEKVGQTVQMHIHDGNKAEMTERLKNGQIGSILTIFEVEKINWAQKIAVEESRLGIPLLVGADVIHGLRTIFPIPLANACTWDPELIEAAAHIYAEEAIAQGIHWSFAPMIDITRDPRWGRIAEGAGEDPFLGAVMAAAQVRGFQTPLSNGRKLTACPKHYCAYGWSEAGKDYNSTDLSERTLRDVVLPPFKAAFEAGAGSTMSAFNDLSGIPASANPLTLRQILRDEWDFKGIVVSDWNSVGELIPHGFAADLKEAARRAFLAGVELDMASEAYHTHLADLVREGAVPEARLDEAVRRILRLKFALGLFENAQTDPAQAQSALLKPEYRQKALEVATKSMVLLKNEGELLPIHPDKIKRLALIGPLADDHHEIMGSWSWTGNPADSETILEGLQQTLPSEIEIVHTQGCDLTGEQEPNFSAAIETAQNADIAVLVLGEGKDMSGEAHNRTQLGLPGHQQALLEAVSAAGTPVVVVLLTGRPLAIPWMAANIPSILLAWQGGIRTGQAVADLLMGRANPGGKLTATWPRSVGQIPIYYYFKNTGRPAAGPGTQQFKDPFRTVYLDEKVSPLFPFGWGLSYTSFQYSNLQVHTPEIHSDEVLEVSVKIRNTGTVTGEEIAQLYVRDLVGEVTRPVKELKGFQKISLQPGESQTVRFKIPAQSLGFHGLDMTYKVEPGDFKVWVGPNAAEGLEGDFKISAR